MSNVLWSNCLEHLRGEPSIQIGLRYHISVFLKGVKKSKTVDIDVALRTVYSKGSHSVLQRKRGREEEGVGEGSKNTYVTGL